MIPVEYLWFTLILFWGFIGSARALAKEIGASAVLLLSLFTLFMLWEKIISKFVGAGGTGQLELIQAAYYGIVIIFVAYISYQGFVLSFPMRESGGILGGLLGFVGGLVNGYLIIGTLWDVVAQADYFRPKLHLVSGNLSHLHNVIVHWLPISLMHRTSPFVFLVPGMFLLLLIVIK